MAAMPPGTTASAPQGLIDFCAVAMMQKDEGDQLRCWIDHYTSLFEPGAITIFDNGSTDPETLRQLDRAEALGVTMDRSHTSAAAFARKGDLLLQRFRELADRYAFFLPADCDELLVAGDPANGNLAADIAAEFQTLRESPHTIFRISQEYRNAADRPLFVLRGCWKVLLTRELPPFLDKGAHLYDFPNKIDALPRIGSCAFRNIHFHNKPFHLMLLAARQKLKSQTSDFDPATMARYRGPGEHLSPKFAMGLAEYSELAAKKARLNLGAWLGGRGVAPPFADEPPLTSDDDDRLAFARRTINAAAHATSSGLGEAAIELLEPLLWRAGSYLEFSAGGSAINLVRVAGVARRALIRTAALPAGHSASGTQIYLRRPPRWRLRWLVMRFAAIPDAHRDFDVALIDGPFPLACLMSAYRAAASSDYRIVMPNFGTWTQAAAITPVFTVERRLGDAAILRPIPGREQLAARIADESGALAQDRSRPWSV